MLVNFQVEVSCPEPKGLKRCVGRGRGQGTSVVAAVVGGRAPGRDGTVADSWESRPRRRQGVKPGEEHPWKAGCTEGSVAGGRVPESTAR